MKNADFSPSEELARLLAKADLFKDLSLNELIALSMECRSIRAFFDRSESKEDSLVL